MSNRCEKCGEKAVSLSQAIEFRKELSAIMELVATERRISSEIIEELKRALKEVDENGKKARARRDTWKMLAKLLWPVGTSEATRRLVRERDQAEEKLERLEATIDYVCNEEGHPSMTSSAEIKQHLAAARWPKEGEGDG